MSAEKTTHPPLWWRRRIGQTVAAQWGNKRARAVVEDVNQAAQWVTLRIAGDITWRIYLPEVRAHSVPGAL